MIRQLGKPTMFLTLSASEYDWNDLLRLLYRLENNGSEWEGGGVPETSMSSDLQTTLVNEDPVTCCLYFNKLVDTIIFILSNSSYSPFGRYHVVDWFKRVVFQQQGSSHCHILLWLANDPKESVSEHMPQTITLLDALCSVDESKIERTYRHKHKHTFTCYKRCTDEENKVCRFGAPFWPMDETRVLLPMPEDDCQRTHLRELYADMHQGLEFGVFDSLDALWRQRYKKLLERTSGWHYLALSIFEANLTSEDDEQLSSVDRKNTPIKHRYSVHIRIIFVRFIYYVVEYFNKTNRGISDLNREQSILRDEYPDLDFVQLAMKAGTKLLDSVEMSCQKDAWYLLNLHMSEASHKCDYISTIWP